MLLVRKISELKKMLGRIHSKNISLGFVPTMGDLHEGHLSLILRSKKENRFTAVSIFVNPSQFSSKDDFKKYFHNERGDLRLLKKEKVDLVFLPRAEELYPKRFQTWVNVENLTQSLCGAFRPGHFRGVATIVLKLFELVKPDIAYFGLKDYQQFKVIEKMVHDLNLSVRVVGCPTVREPDGLALSSRNRRLSPEERQRAPNIHLGLKLLVSLSQSGRIKDLGELRKRFLAQLQLKENDRLEYLEFVHPETLTLLKKISPPVLLACAVWIGKTRLIDNLFIPPSPLPLSQRERGKKSRE